jgi:hypothetical protein
VNHPNDFCTIADVNPYVALRVCPGASAPAWWEAARERRDRPVAVAALLAGRRRVELSPDEAASVLTWAGAIAGWSAADPKPLFVHEPDVSS